MSLITSSSLSLSLPLLLLLLLLSSLSLPVSLYMLNYDNGNDSFVIGMGVGQILTAKKTYSGGQKFVPKIFSPLCFVG